MITGAEARKKWCPLARTQNYDTGAAVGGRTIDGQPDQNCLCIASDCMAWRWIHATMQGGLGYCGAFGHPAPMMVVQQ